MHILKFDKKKTINIKTQPNHSFSYFFCTLYAGLTGDTVWQVKGVWGLGRGWEEVNSDLYRGNVWLRKKLECCDLGKNANNSFHLRWSILQTKIIFAFRNFFPSLTLICHLYSRLKSPFCPFDFSLALRGLFSQPASLPIRFLFFFKFDQLSFVGLLTD